MTNLNVLTSDRKKKTKKWSDVFARACKRVYKRCTTANPCDDAYMGILDLQYNLIRSIPADLNAFNNLPLFIIILESPHIDEFDDYGIAIGPAQGKTGISIREHLARLIPNNVRRQSYRLMLVESIPFPCSNCEKPLKHSMRDRLFKMMWSDYGGSDDLKNRISQYAPNVILNACSGGKKNIDNGCSLNGLVQKVLDAYGHEHTNVQLLYSNHPVISSQFMQGIFVRR